jgi:hypothetical protein
MISAFLFLLKAKLFDYLVSLHGQCGIFTILYNTTIYL